jgi:hypothetical protein
VISSLQSAHIADSVRLIPEPSASTAPRRLPNSGYRPALLLARAIAPPNFRPETLV